MSSKPPLLQDTVSLSWRPPTIGEFCVKTYRSNILFPFCCQLLILALCSVCYDEMEQKQCRVTNETQMELGGLKVNCSLPPLPPFHPSSPA